MQSDRSHPAPKEGPVPRQQTLPGFDREREYYDYVAHGYDLISSSYDNVEAVNPVGRRLRAKMQQALLRTFLPGDHVLELGCGTGIEALALARNDIEILATDLSAGMVEKVRRKATELGVGNLEVRCLAASEIDCIVSEFGKGAFDGAYSHGGALNMDPQLGKVARGLASLIRPSGKFLCTIVNQASLFETVFYPLVLKPRKAFRRLGNDVPIPISRLRPHDRYVVPTRFYSPRAFTRIFQPEFALRRLEGLQIVLPPWNLVNLVTRLAPVMRGFEAIEDRISNRPPFNSWGSIFLAEFELIQ